LDVQFSFSGGLFAPRDWVCLVSDVRRHDGDKK
jgi:hypothetical protein